MKGKDGAAASVGLHQVGETGFDAGALVAEGEGLAVRFQLIGKADAVFFGLNFVAGESFAFFFGFDDASGDGIDIEKIVRFTVAGFHGEFANGDAAARGDVGFFARLHDPASIGEETVDILPCAGFGGIRHVIGGLSIAQAGRKKVSRRDSEFLDKRAQPGMAVPRREDPGSIVEFSQGKLQKAKADPSQRSG